MTPERTCSNCGALLPDDAPASALCPACTQSAGAQTRIMRSPSLETIGDYEVVDKLGQGGMGAVYRARQLSLGRLVALKVLPHQFGDDAEFIGRFQREAKVAATLNHANLVRVYAAGQADGCHYIAMELIEGENLHQRMRRERLPIPEALRICADVARGLQYGWERAQLVHRDIKPSNVYLSHGGEVKVGDLGLAKSLTGNTTGLTQSGTMMGTPHYMSPEQIRGDKALDFRADVYSLGCTLYELLTGQPPYPGSDPISIARAHLDAPLPAIMRALPGCPMPLVRLVGKMLKKTPRERHGSYEDLVAEMDWVREQIETGAAPTTTAPRATAPAATPPSPTPRTPSTAVPPKAKPNAMLYASLAAGVLVIAALAWWLVPSKPKKTSRVASTTKTTPSNTPTTPAAGPRFSPSTEPWQDHLADMPAWAVTREGAALRVQGSPAVTLPTASADGAIRVLFAPGPDNHGTTLVIRDARPATNGWYQFAMNATNAALMAYEPKPRSLGPRVNYASEGVMVPGKPVELELRAIGTRITASINGKVVASANDPAFTTGSYRAHFQPGTLVYGLQTLDLSPATARATTSATGWQPLLSDTEWKTTRPGREFVDGLLHLTGGTIPIPQPSSDAAIRARVRLRDGSRTGQVFLRSSIEEGKLHGYIHDTLAAAELVRTGPAGTPARGIRKTLPKPLASGDLVQLELRAQGQHVTFLVNETVVAEMDDTTVRGPGTWGIHGKDAWFESVEVQSLPAASTSAPSPVSAELWQDVLGDPAQLSFGSYAERTPEGLRFHRPGSALLPQDRGPRRDGAVRMRATYGGFRTGVIVRSSTQGVYQLSVTTGGTKINLDRWDQVAKQAKALRVFTLSKPLEVGQDYELELRIVGQELTAKFNGEVAAAVTSDHLTEGQFGVGANDIESNSGPTLVKSVEILDLDAPAGDGPWTEHIAPVLAKGQLQSWWKQVGSGLQVSLVQGVILDRTHRENVAIRVTARSEGDAAAWWVMLRLAEPGRYGAKLERNGRGRIFLKAGSKESELAVFDLPAGFSIAENHTMEFRAQGDRLSVAVDGRELGVVYDRTHTSGIFEIMGTPGTIFEKVELRELTP